MTDEHATKGQEYLDSIVDHLSTNNEVNIIGIKEAEIILEEEQFASLAGMHTTTYGLPHPIPTGILRRTLYVSPAAELKKPEQIQEFMYEMLTKTYPTSMLDNGRSFNLQSHTVDFPTAIYNTEVAELKIVSPIQNATLVNVNGGELFSQDYSNEEAPYARKHSINGNVSVVFGTNSDIANALYEGTLRRDSFNLGTTHQIGYAREDAGKYDSSLKPSLLTKIWG